MCGSNVPAKATKTVIRQQRMTRIWDLWTRGCTNKSQIAAALGTNVNIVTKDMKCIEQEWLRQTRVTMAKQRARRIQQLETIAYEARNAFDRSRQDSQEYSIVTKICEECRGLKEVQVEENVAIECPVCSGKGTISTETVKTHGQAGDASFLRVATTAVMEAGKMSGLYTRENDPVVGSTYRMDVTNIHNEINVADGGHNPFSKASPQAILEAKAALARLTESARDVDEDDPNTIEVEAE